MKKIFSLVLAALVGAGSLFACAKKTSAANRQPSEMTIIVMDTTQALLDGAQVKAGTTVLTTSYDGRVVLQPEQLSDVKKITVSRKDYETATIRCGASASNGEPVLVKLKPKPLAPAKNDKDLRYSRRETTMTATRTYGAVAKMAPGEDGVVYMEEPMPMVDVADHAPMSAGVSNHVSAGKLTAGEVNDFSKWYLWPGVIDRTHKEYVSVWRIEPRQRYTVQVVNKQGYPVVNYPVNLEDMNGNTLFQTLTDNTGKAEVWNNLFSSEKEENVRISVAGQKLQVPENSMPFALNPVTVTVDEPCEASDAVDVMFVFDATGSMGDELRYLQAEMKDVIARATDATGGLAIRTGAVVYRDHGDDYITRLSRLTDDLGVTQSFIDKQEAGGGGDYEEAVPEALMAAMNSAGWNSYARARIAFLVLDAPCHDNQETLALLHEQVRTAAAFGVRIVPVVCSGLREKGEYLMRSIALATNGTSFFLTDDSGIGHKHLKPATDSLKVEHLNDMLVRTIVEFSLMPECSEEAVDPANNQVEDEFIPNPFSAQELAENPSIPHGAGVHYLVDVSGKLLAVFEGEIADYQSQITKYTLPVGVYFIKTYTDGKWYTKKIFVR